MRNFKITLAFITIFFIVSFCKEDKSDKNEIIAFSVDGQIGESIIDPGQHTVTIETDTSVNLSILEPVITISDKASIQPPSGVITDFSKGPVTYIVTAEDGSEKEWKATITFEKSDSTEILGFKVNGQSGGAIIADSTVNITVYKATDLTKVKPEITISEGATISPASGQEVDFSGGTVTYTVTAESGVEKNWVVTIVAKSSEKDIVSCSIPGQIGEPVKGYKSYTFEVAFGTDISSIIPDIVVSEGATMSPASGVAADFSVNGCVSYIITAENGKTSTWNIFVYYRIIEADNENIQYYGRIDFSNPKRPKFWAPGAYIMAKFTGNYCEIVLNDEVRYNTSQNYLEVIIDGTNQQRIKTVGVYNSIKIADDLADGEHTILICKDTEAEIGYIEFLGFRCENLIALPAKPERKLEFIGNSITCGTGSDLSVVPCGTGNWYDQHNAYMSYGPVTARRLNAQWYLSSVSGIGVIHSCCDLTYIITDAYNKIKLNPNNSSDWDFSSYIPDAVTICLGQNDGNQDSTAFCSAYVNFIRELRGYYPGAHIICLTSPMADANLTAILQKYLTGIVNYCNTNGDVKVHKFFFSRSYNSGCDTHPDLGQHQLIADELEQELKNILGW